MWHLPNILRLLALTLFSLSSLASAAIGDVFNVKSGTTVGGCDANLSDLESYFEEAVDIINQATTSFNNYNTDQEIQKIARAFFGIQPAADGNGPNTSADATKLTTVQQAFIQVQTLVTGTVTTESPMIFCNSDIWEETDDYYDVQAGPPRTAKFEPGASASLEFLMLGKCVGLSDDPPTLKLYWSQDLLSYDCPSINPDGLGMNGECQRAGTWGYSSGGRQSTFCPYVFSSPKSPALDTSQDIGTYLADLEPKSLTIIHEMFHLTNPGGLLSDPWNDLLSWFPPLVIPITLQDGTLNPDWPGSPVNFVLSSIINSPKGNTADNPTDLLLLALLNTEPVYKNPQNYAWAAVAVYLAKNGKMLDYSTGVARALLSPAAGPQRRNGESHVGYEFRA